MQTSFVNEGKNRGISGCGYQRAIPGIFVVTEVL